MASLEKSPYRDLKIRVGQVWRRQNNGRLFEISGRRSGGRWATRNPSGKKAHGISEVNLKLHCDLLER